MAPIRYDQFCPLARAAEIVGERWTLLVVRELLCGPQRFSDLRRRLPGLSSSVLTERLARLEERGLVARRDAPPPAPALLYELTPLGRKLRPVMLELMRFGLNFLEPMRPGDHLEPEWLRLGLEAMASSRPSPERSFSIRIPDSGRDVVFHVEGGSGGARVRHGEHPAEVSLRAPPLVLLGLVTGALDPATAAAGEGVEIEGDAHALRDLPAMFELIPSPDAPISEDRLPEGAAADAAAPPNPPTR